MWQLLTLISSGDLGQHPGNTLSKFTNTLPEAMVPKLSMFFRIRLRSIAISNILQEEDPYGGVVKIYLEETEKQTTVGLFENCLGTFDTRHADVHGGYHFFEFKHTPFVKIARSPLTTLSVFITNAVNSQLKLAESYPTFLVLELTDQKMPSQFQITCYSHLESETEEQVFPNEPSETYFV